MNNYTREHPAMSVQYTARFTAIWRPKGTLPTIISCGDNKHQRQMEK